MLKKNDSLVLTFFISLIIRKIMSVLQKKSNELCKVTDYWLGNINFYNNYILYQ